MSNVLSDQEKRSLSTMFLVWLIINTVLWLSCNVLVAFTLLGQSLPNAMNPLGAVAGAFSGLFLGLAQWVFLRRYFSLSLIWILTCILGFALYYSVNWYVGAILMAISQQFILYRKFGDIYIWAIASIVGIGVGGYLLAHQQNALLYGSIYAFLTGSVLLWYKSKTQNIVSEQNQETN